MDAVKWKTRPIRILHVVGGMNRGGVQTWLMHVLGQIDRERYQMDFLVHTTIQCDYDDEVRALGGRIIPCLHPSRPWRYAHNFSRALRAYGPYDIVHSHVHHFSGLVLRLAHRAGVPARIAHSHTDRSVLEASAGPVRQAYLGLMGRLIDRHATAGLAVSEKAARSLYGRALDLSPGGRHRILHYGIDLEPFRPEAREAEARDALGIAPEAFVVGHVGNFLKVKNHRFIIAVFAEVRRRVGDAWLLLVGAGPLLEPTRQEAERAGVANRVVFAGSRGDVPRLMAGAMDAFVFPSYYEGLGLVTVEAQAAGLPCVISDVIPIDVDVVPGLVRRLSLSDPPGAWADAIVETRAIRRDEVAPAAWQAMEASSFSSRRGVPALAEIYDQLVGAGAAGRGGNERAANGTIRDQGLE